MSETQMSATEIPLISFWNGRPIDELTRDELIEIIEHLARNFRILEDYLEDRSRRWADERRVH